MINLLIHCLAVWRLSHMLVEEDGPMAVFVRLRYAVGLRQTAVNDGQRMQITYVASGPVAELFDCVWCMSVWMAMILALPPLRPLRRVLATSAGAILIHEVIVKWRYHPE